MKLDDLTPEQRKIIEQGFNKMIEAELAFYKRMGLSAEQVKSGGEAFKNFIASKTLYGQDSTAKTPIARKFFIVGYNYNQNQKEQQHGWFIRSKNWHNNNYSRK